MSGLRAESPWVSDGRLSRAKVLSPRAQEPGPSQPGFGEELYRARQVRGDWAFGEQLLDIAENAANASSYNERTGKLSVNRFCARN